MTGAAFICEKNVNYLYILSLELVGLAQTHMHTLLCTNIYICKALATKSSLTLNLPSKFLYVCTLLLFFCCQTTQFEF